jgi:hypothetical protein
MSAYETPSYDMTVYPKPKLATQPFITQFWHNHTTTGTYYLDAATPSPYRGISWFNQDEEVPISKFVVSHLPTSSISSGTV